MLGFEERGKPEYPDKNLSEQEREPTTNSTHIWWEASVLTSQRKGWKEGEREGRRRGREGGREGGREEDSGS